MADWFMMRKIFIVFGSDKKIGEILFDPAGYLIHPVSEYFCLSSSTTFCATGFGD